MYDLSTDRALKFYIMGYIELLNRNQTKIEPTELMGHLGMERGVAPDRIDRVVTALLEQGIIKTSMSNGYIHYHLASLSFRPGVEKDHHKPVGVINVAFADLIRVFGVANCWDKRKPEIRKWTLYCDDGCEVTIVNNESEPFRIEDTRIWIIKSNDKLALYRVLTRLEQYEVDHEVVTQY